MTRLLLLAPCAVALAVGCGGSAVVLQSSDGGTDSAADAGDAADSGEAAATATNVGGVWLASVSSPAANPPGDSSDIQARFALALTSACPPETIVDGCSLIDCNPIGPSPAEVGAGTLLVTGGKQPVTLAWTKAKNATTASYAPQSLPHLWEGGEALQVIGAGDVAPAFDLALIAPAYVTIDTPVLPTGAAALTIPRSTDFKVTWSGGGAGFVVVEFTFQPGYFFVSCRYPAQSGLGKVSAKVLGMLPATGTLEIVSQTYVEKKIPDWTVFFAARASANTPTGVAKAGVTLQ